MPRQLPFNEAQARAAIAQARNWTEAARLLGYRPVGGNIVTLKKYARRWDISTAHFNPKAAMLDALDRGRHRRTSRPLEEVLVVGSTYNRGRLKERLFAEGLKERRCELCGQGEVWNGRRMSLVLDHINGVGDDNRLENLRIVCPNCDATLDTHCGRNLPRRRTCVGCGKEFAPTHLTHRYCSLTCFNGWRLATVGTPNSVSTFGVPMRSRRRVERPPYDELVSEIEQNGYVATGRKYGVSDNAVRKWVRFYEHELARREAEAA